MPITKRTVKSRWMVTPKGDVVMVHIKWSSDKKAAAAGRSWYLVIDGNVKFPTKEDGLPTRESVEVPDLVRSWANNLLINVMGYKVHKA